MAAFAPGLSFALRLVPRGSHILAQFGASSSGVPGVGLHDRRVWTEPVSTGLPPRTSREDALAWARTAFPGADVQWGGHRSSMPVVSGDGMPHEAGKPCVLELSSPGASELVKAERGGR
jgi:hypothetical protein